MRDLSHIGLIILLMASSCTITKNVSLSDTRINQITITSNNLSEDASILSTNEDELLFLVFDFEADSPKELFLEETFTFDKDSRRFSISVDMIDWHKPKLFALIELDSTTPAYRISAQVKMHYQDLIHAFQRHDLEQIESILNDDDLLGIQVSKEDDLQINFNGTWRMDRYEYQINLIAHR